MSATPTSPPTGFILFDLRTVVLIIIVAAVAIVLERSISTYLKRFANRAKLEPYTTNNLVLITRILILLGSLGAIADLSGLPPEWLLSLSAIIGAALGFASQKTIGNFIAGLFLLAARPFRVGDYVRIGTVEGLVQEITINYTKVFTSANNTVAVSNLQVLDRDITNFSLESDKTGKTPGIYCYTFEMGFDHNVAADKIGSIFDDVFKTRLSDLPQKPTYTLLRSGAFERVYLVYLYVKRPEDIFRFRSQIAEEIYRSWDKERSKPKG